MTCFLTFNVIAVIHTLSIFNVSLRASPLASGTESRSFTLLCDISSSSNRLLVLKNMAISVAPSDPKPLNPRFNFFRPVLSCKVRMTHAWFKTLSSHNFNLTYSRSFALVSHTCNHFYHVWVVPCVPLFACNAWSRTPSVAPDVREFRVTLFRYVLNLLVYWWHLSSIAVL